MAYQAQCWQTVVDNETASEAPRTSWRFTELYEALLGSEDLIEPELVELGRLVAKRLAACQQPRRAATTVSVTSPVGDLSTLIR